MVMLNAINDLLELQRGEVTFVDISRGKINFQVEMYDFEWEYHFTVEAIDEAHSRVMLEVTGEAMHPANKIFRQFALLDSILPSGTRASPDPEQGQTGHCPGREN
jgi:hypothetical protein